VAAGLVLPGERIENLGGVDFLQEDAGHAPDGAPPTGRAVIVDDIIFARHQP
jgi:hypothetical protein